jgi:hypothetical protein
VLGARGQRLKLVDVVLAQLVGEELIGNADQRLLGEHAGEQQSLGVRGGEEDGVNGKQRVNSA